jgi:hypothetical protein
MGFKILLRMDDIAAGEQVRYRSGSILAYGIDRSSGDFTDFGIIVPFPRPRETGGENLCRIASRSA